MVFFSSCASVKYHAELLNYIDMSVKDIHGKQKQQRRTTTFMDFCKAEKGAKVHLPDAHQLLVIGACHGAPSAKQCVHQCKQTVLQA